MIAVTGVPPSSEGLLPRRSMSSHVPRRPCVQDASKVGEVPGEDGTARESSRALIGQVSIAPGIHRHAVPDDNIEK